MKISSVCLQLKASTFEEAVFEMLESLNLNENQTNSIAALVIDRESKATTCVGNQVAFPHCKTTEISGIKIVFGRKDEPIMFGSEKDKKVKLIFMIISSISEIREHLRVLSSLAKPLKNKEKILEL